MNRIDRLFAILLMLQTRKWITAQNIADKFEISERTVYRDMSALLQMGVPIISQAGEGYSLLEGYYLPPLIFTTTEARAIFLGLKMLQSSGNLLDASFEASQKIEAALPQRTLNKAKQQAELIEFYPKAARFDLDNPRLQIIQQAILEQQVLHIGYFSRSDETQTQRDIEPLRLIYADGAWYIDAYCRLRQDLRSFRLERIESIQPTTQQFEAKSPNFPEQSQIEIEIRFQRDIVRWVHERQHYGFISEATLDSGDMLMYYQVHQFTEIKAWLLGWGANAEIMSPEDLRQQMRKEVEKMLTLLT